MSSLVILDNGSHVTAASITEMLGDFDPMLSVSMIKHGIIGNIPIVLKIRSATLNSINEIQRERAALEAVCTGKSENVLRFYGCVDIAEYSVLISREIQGSSLHS